MKTSAASLLLIVGICALACAETFVVPGVAKQPGVPLVFSGTVTMSETIVADKVRIALLQNDITATNKSQKAIIAMVIEINLHYPHATEGRTYQYDCFFAPGAILPNDSNPVSSMPVDDNITEVPLGSVPRSEPQVEVRVPYVQFTDGSEFGEVTFASRLMTSRRILYRALERIDRAWKRHGQAEFLEELNERLPDLDAEAALQAYRDTTTQMGIDRGVKQIETALSWARQRKNLLRDDLREGQPENEK